jgi:hypothetical protein
LFQIGPAELSTYLRNIETGKSKKEFGPSLAISEREQRATLYISREPPGRKKGEKILVPVHFFFKPGEKPPQGRATAAGMIDLCVIA